MRRPLIRPTGTMAIAASPIEKKGVGEYTARREQFQARPETVEKHDAQDHRIRWGAPGMPRVSSSAMLPATVTLLLDPEAINPSGVPLPKRSGCFEARLASL